MTIYESGLRNRQSNVPPIGIFYGFLHIYRPAAYVFQQQLPLSSSSTCGYKPYDPRMKACRYMDAQTIKEGGDNTPPQQQKTTGLDSNESGTRSSPTAHTTNYAPLRLTLFLQRYALLIALAGLIVLFSALRPETFFTLSNLTTILSIQATAAMLAIGVTIVLLIGEFDLSLAAVMGMSASVVAYMSTQQGLSVFPACAVALIAAVMIGLVNAFFVVRVGIHSFIVTIAMGTLVQGLAIGVAGTTTIGGLPNGFTDFFRYRILGVQSAFFIVLAIGIVFYIVIGRMPIGRSLFFIGNARSAAELAGIRTQRMRAGVLGRV